MNINIVSLFPEFFDSVLCSGLMSKARENGIVEFSMVSPRDYALDRHRTVDDRPYGGGPGMVMELETACAALDGLERPGRMLLLSPRGKPFDQTMARELAGEESLTLICGRYEGLDARLEELYPLEPVSVGDFVLNGGEAAALCVTEAVSRLLPGFMGHEDSGEEESFSASLLEYPHYTRPESFRGLDVPEVLRSGDHGRIAGWRREKALEATLALRPDLLRRARLDGGDLRHLRSLGRARLGRSLYLALAHAPVLNKFGEVGTVSLTNLDIHDMSRVSRSYGLGGFFVITPLEDQRELARDLTRHWVEGAGGRSNPDRGEALKMVRVAETLDEAVRHTESLAGQPPLLAVTSARTDDRRETGTPREIRDTLRQRPVLLVFGTASGLAPEVLEGADVVLRPLRYMDRYNHLPVRSAVSITVDRILGDEF